MLKLQYFLTLIFSAAFIALTNAQTPTSPPPMAANNETVAYYPNGKVKWRYTLIDNKLEGWVKSFWPDGKKKREEFYENGNVVKGDIWNEKGEKVAFYPFIKDAEFPGGTKAIQAFIARNVKYPSSLMGTAPSRITVYVKFSINESGSVENAQVEKHTYPEMEKEALRVINALPKFSPASMDGLYQKYNFRIPITFVYSE